LKDGETVIVNFPKEEALGLINNQLENLTFKVDGVSVCGACGHMQQP
jgi:hypothetical protein